MKKHLSLLLLSLTTLLSGCTNFNEDQATQFQSLTQTQQAQYWQTKKLQDITHRIQQQGAAVYVNGDEYQIIIPANRLFKGNTPQLNGSENAVLQPIVDLINAQSTPAVRIITYANIGSSTQRNLGLSQSWAETVLQQLRDKGLLAALLSTEWYGTCDPTHPGYRNVGYDNMDKHSAYSNRIEIDYRISHGN